jgi:hypothetical protein
MTLTLVKRLVPITICLVSLIIISSSVLTRCSPADTQDQSSQRKVNISPPPDGYGLYESCAPKQGSSCLDRLKQMAMGGFKLVVNYDQFVGSAEDQLTYAQQADALGMKVIWAMNNPVFWDGTSLINHYPDLAATCDCSDNTAFVRYVINLVKDLPATWGYYVGDEVLPSNHAEVKTFADLVKHIDPSHPRLFISCAQCDHDKKRNPPYVASLIPMTDTADVVGADWYPVGSGSDVVATTSTVATDVQAVADKAHKQSALVLQSFNWSQYSSYHSCEPYPSCVPYPTVAQMREMRDLTLQESHPRLILWYSYFDILREDNPSLHWQNLVEAVGATPVSSKVSALP